MAAGQSHLLHLVAPTHFLATHNYGAVKFVNSSKVSLMGERLSDREEAASKNEWPLATRRWRLFVTTRGVVESRDGKETNEDEGAMAKGRRREHAPK